MTGSVTLARDDKRRVNLLVLCGLALVVGVMTGCGAVALRALIGFFHNAFYNGTFSIWYDANISEGPSRFGDWVVLSPVLGGLVVVFLVQRFAPEAKGHGVPEVMDAVFYKHGNIRGQVAIIKSLASALSIGSGAAVGREGPIIQIGAALGSAFSQAIKLSTWQKITLLSAGAGAGIAATFNTPLGGVLFALEILLPEVSNRTFLPVVVATGAATTIGRILIGPDPAFVVPDIQLSLAQSLGLEEAIAFVVLGILCGVASWAFIRLLVIMEDGFPKLPGNAYTQNILGMAVIGLMMVVLTHFFGHPYVDGVGYGVIQSTLDNKMTSAGLLALLFALKMLATTISLGCGASGGIFSPSLYLGATLGGAFAIVVGTDLSACRHNRAVGGDRRHGRDGWRGHRRRHDRHRHGLRDDARLRHHRSRHRRGRDGGRHPARADRRDDLYDQAAPSRPPHPEGAAHQSLSGQAGPGHHGTAFHPGQGRNIAERQPSGAEDTDDLRAIIVEREGRIVGLIPPRSGLWRESQTNPNLLVERFVESRAVICRDVDLLSLVFARLKRHRSGAAIVFQRRCPAKGPRYRRRHHQTLDRRHRDRQLRRLSGEPEPRNPHHRRACPPRHRPRLYQSGNLGVTPCSEPAVEVDEDRTEGGSRSASPDPRVGNAAQAKILAL